MLMRSAVFARQRWYPASESACRRSIEEFEGEAALLEPAAALPVTPVAGLVPHAGWAYSGLVAAAVFRVLAERVSPDVLVFFGSCHVPGVAGPTLWNAGAWETPLGAFEVDGSLVEALGRLEFVESATEPHEREHSIEVQLPFVKRLWPAARLVAFLVPPSRDAVRLGLEAARLVRGRPERILAVGSTDMTHYGPRYGFTPRGVGAEAHQWVVEENDPRMIERIARLDAEGVVEEARIRHNACSAGAIQATLAYARERGAARGALVHYTTSERVHPERVATDFVGYSGFVF